MNFNDLNIQKPILSAIAKLGFESPTEIQEKAIPILLSHNGDFVGQAQTGTGKTGAFVIPLLEKLDFKSKKPIQALVLTPTRELAHQVAEEVEKFGTDLDLDVCTVYGGVSYQKQILSLTRKKPQIVVGTPGRIIDLINQKMLKLANVEYLVIDEADEMLNMGFLEDVKTIISELNEKRRIWMFSATMPTPILNMIDRNFTDTQVVRIQKTSMSNALITQQFCVVRPRDTAEALCRFMESQLDFYGIVFCETRREAKELIDELLMRGVNGVALHGEMSQTERDLAMQKFKAKKVRLLICTDVAARGIDVSNVSHVINLGVPRSLESYVHRIGRTGRAGVEGVALTFIAPEEMNRIRRVENFTRVRMTQYNLPKAKEIAINRVVKELEKMDKLKTTITKAKFDEVFEAFKQFFAPSDREEILKLFFASKFNFLEKPIKELDDMIPEKRRAPAYQQRRPSHSSSGGRYRQDSRRSNSESSSSSTGRSYRSTTSTSTSKSKPARGAATDRLSTKKSDTGRY